MGLTVSSEWNFWPELRSGKVVTVLDDWALPPTHLSAVYPTGRLASTKARAFVSYVERFMAAELGLPAAAARVSKIVREGTGRHAQ
jgi:DNA-binding transcriptional LysR family regulator